MQNRQSCASGDDFLRLYQNGNSFYTQNETNHNEQPYILSGNVNADKIMNFSVTGYGNNSNWCYNQLGLEVVDNQATAFYKNARMSIVNDMIMSTGNVTRTQEIKSYGASMIADSGINHNEGSLLNNALFVTGRYLKGIQLNGGNQSVSAYNNSDSLSHTDKLTIDLWIKPYATDALRVLVAKDKEGYSALGNYVLTRIFMLIYYL